MLKSFSHFWNKNGTKWNRFVHHNVTIFWGIFIYCLLRDYLNENSLRIKNKTLHMHSFLWKRKEKHCLSKVLTFTENFEFNCPFSSTKKDRPKPKIEKIRIFFNFVRFSLKKKEMSDSNFFVGKSPKLSDSNDLTNLKQSRIKWFFSRFTKIV